MSPTFYSTRRITLKSCFFLLYWLAFIFAIARFNFYYTYSLIHINVTCYRVLIKTKRIRVQAFFLRFISCAAIRELFGRCCNTIKKNGIIKTETVSDGNYTDVLSEAEETRAEETATSAHSALSVYRYFESPPFTHLYTIRGVYAPRIMHRIPPAGHRWWSCLKEKKNNRLA